MNAKRSFGDWWMRHSEMTHEDREKSFSSLTRRERKELITSLYEENWHELFYQNQIDELLDYVKIKYGIDLIDLRIKALKHKKIFIHKKVWNDIEELFWEYKDVYDLGIVFGGLVVSLASPKGSHYVIKSTA